MPKRLDKPATINVRATPASPPNVIVTRKMTLPREGSGVEDVYAAVASRESWQLESWEQHGRRAWRDGLRYWFLLILFWGAVVILIGHWRGM